MKEPVSWLIHSSERQTEKNPKLSLHYRGSIMCKKIPSEVIHLPSLQCLKPKWEILFLVSYKLKKILLHRFLLVLSS